MVSGVDGRAVSMVAVGAILSRQIWPYSPRWYGCMVGAKTGRKNAPNCVCGLYGIFAKGRIIVQPNKYGLYRRSNYGHKT